MKRRPGRRNSTATGGSQGHDRPVTLGALLYADHSRQRIPEQEWVAAVRAIADGDEAALHSLFQRAHRIAFTLIMRITQNRETAEELTVDVFHDVWRRAPRYDPANGPVLGWILNQARSRAIDRVRHERRRKRMNHFAHELPEELDGSNYDDTLHREELTRRIRLAAGILTPQEREAIEAAYFSGMTHAEVAAHLDEPLGTVKTRIRSGLAKLRQQLARDAEDS